MYTYTCPVCQKKMTKDEVTRSRHAPFCSERCRMIDLGRWLGGDYTISSPAKPDDLLPPSDKPDE